MLKFKDLPQHFFGRGPLIHVVLDGWGVGEANGTNAIHMANLPMMTRLKNIFPYTELWTHGSHVGLPNEKDLGGSEVGHMTMGSGIIMEQGPTLIEKLILTGEFFDNPVLNKVINNCIFYDTPLHLLGLLSDGNIHSNIDHTKAIISHAFECSVPKIVLPHIFLDFYF